MKTIFTLVTAITLSLFVYGQSPDGFSIPPELQERFEQIENYNTAIREQISPVRQTPTIKLDSIISWRYDSIINSWYELNKYVLTFHPNGMIKTWKSYDIQNIYESNYNSNGNLTSRIFYNYQFGYWVLNSKYEVTYDANFNKIESKSYKRVGNNWVLNYKENWTYDSSSNLLSQISYQVQGGITANQFKLEYTYNSSNLETSKSDYYWDNGQWVYAYKTERDYDPNGNEILRILYYGDVNSWKPDSKGVTTFTSFDMPEMRLSYSWDTLLANWVARDSSWAVYNMDNLLQSDTTYRWYNSNWTYDLLNEKVYDNNNNVVLEEEKTWDWNSWRNYSKSVRQYDTDNRRVLLAEYFWNYDDGYWMNNFKFESHYYPTGDSAYGINSFGQDSLWVESTKGVNYYDINVSVDDITPQGFFWAPFQLLKAKYYYQRNGQWEFADSTKYYYSDFVTGIQDVSNDKISVYPNPTNDYLNITGDFNNEIQVEISDVSGKVIRVLSSTDSTTRLNVQDLKSGMYFIRITDGEQSVVKKIIKQ